jgi:FixJ family two-component response regulator
VEYGPLTVAVIDDDTSMRMSIQRLLSVSGFVAEGFASAEELLDLRTEIEYGCAILDVNLPGMNGIELMHKLSSLNPLFPIIVITALDDEKLENAAVRAGCAAFLRKPFAPELLLKFVTDATSAARRG